jgi:hypothetical protein
MRQPPNKGLLDLGIGRPPICRREDPRVGALASLTTSTDAKGVVDTFV